MKPICGDGYVLGVPGVMELRGGATFLMLGPRRRGAGKHALLTRFWNSVAKLSYGFFSSAVFQPILFFMHSALRWLMVEPSMRIPLFSKRRQQSDRERMSKTTRRLTLSLSSRWGQ